MRSDCHLKSQLLYMELVTAQGLLKIFKHQNLSFSSEYEQLVQKATIFYQHFAKVKNNAATNFGDLDTQFQKYLSEFRQMRTLLWIRLGYLLSLQNSSFPIKKTTLDQLADQLTFILEQIQENRPLSPEVRQRYETSLANFVNGLNQHSLMFPLPVLVKWVGYLLTHNPYYQLSAMGFTAVEEMTSSSLFKKIPLMNVQLTENYRQFFKIVTASAIFINELQNFNNFGMPFLLLQTSTNLLLVNSENKFRALIGMAMVLIFQAGQLWWRNQPITGTMLGLISSWYIAAISAQKIISHVGQRFLHPQQDSSRQFLKLLLAYGGFSLGGWLFLKSINSIWPLLLTKFQEHELLRNTQLCEQHKESCLQVARETLGVTAEASLEQIRAQCRLFALKYHPDKGIVSDEIVAINQACQILKSK